MGRTPILEVAELVYNLLEKEGELSVNSISKKLGIQWRVALKPLESYSRIGVVKERKGKKTNKEERLFSLTDDRTVYGSKE
ncbi:MAG: hypothetical protein PF542_01050 [Nanoarchaeota archaeon]|jgi:Mn-dependent DtxR family transcriptional regulator|nr:hypothetical protein [Nanoarchaeota archaeon]